jgi:hypothetical protein
MCKAYDRKGMQPLCRKQRSTVYDTSGGQRSVRMHLASQLGNQTDHMEYKNGIDCDMRHLPVFFNWPMPLRAVISSKLILY